MAGSNRSGELRPVTSVDVVDPIDGAAQPRGAVLAAAGGARRPRRHDGVAEGGAGGRRELRRQAGLLRAVQVRRARRAGPHRARALCRTTGTRARSTSTRSIYTPIPDATVRLANLQLGPARLHRARRPVATSRSCKSDKRFKIARITEIGYQGITINVGKSELAQKNPLGKDARVREAFELSLDRAGHRAGRDGQRGDRRQPVGRADQPVLREERAGAQARRRARQGAAEGSRRHEPELHADDADHLATRSASRWSCRRWRAKPAST